jgi:hypothetical protein
MQAAPAPERNRSNLSESVTGHRRIFIPTRRNIVFQ